MDVIQESVQHCAVRLGFVVAGLFATCRTHARHGSTHRRACAAEIETHLVESRRRPFAHSRWCTLEHDVAGLAVQCDQTGTVFFPDVAELAQGIGIVMHTGRRHDAQSMKLGCILEYVAVPSSSFSSVKRGITPPP